MGTEGNGEANYRHGPHEVPEDREPEIQERIQGGDDREEERELKERTRGETGGGRDLRKAVLKGKWSCFFEVKGVGVYSDANI